jgi:hypothetical protein
VLPPLGLWERRPAAMNCLPATVRDYRHDLASPIMLALTRVGRPSLIQRRGPKLLPAQIADHLIQSLRRFRADLDAGVLLLIEPGRSRVRVLPL